MNHLLQSQIIKEYNLLLVGMKLLDSHFGTEIYLAQTGEGKYIVKKTPPGAGRYEREGNVTSFLTERGLPVGRLLPAKDGAYAVSGDGYQFTVQAYIEGETWAVNTAPDWFLDESARLLGRIHTVLRDYEPLPVHFDADFFSAEEVRRKKQYLSSQLNACADDETCPELRGQIKHAERILSFAIDAAKFTYANSHGDYYIGQFIAKDRHVSVIDWSSACFLPVCIELMMSYVYAEPLCANGEINGARLIKYIQKYEAHSGIKLSREELALMPYAFYHHQYLTNYTPPFRDVPESYRVIADLVNNTLDWLYEHVEQLSKELSKATL